MAKAGTVPHYLYSNKISEVAETTEAYLAATIRSSSVEKEVLKLERTTRSAGSGEHRGRTSRSI